MCVGISGEQLTTAWVSVLELLSVVPQAEEADTVQLAFQSVQLLCSDYMSSLPVRHLRRCVEVAALYGSQQVVFAAFSLLFGFIYFAVRPKNCMAAYKAQTNDERVQGLGYCTNPTKLWYAAALVCML